MHNDADVAVEMVEEARDVMKELLLDEMHDHALTCEALRALAEVQSKYEELILNVISKTPGETRHQTALRYIREGGGI